MIKLQFSVLITRGSEKMFLSKPKGSAAFKGLPVFHTSTRFHGFKFCSNVSHTTFSNFIEIYHWSAPNQLAINSKIDS